MFAKLLDFLKRDLALIRISHHQVNFISDQGYLTVLVAVLSQLLQPVVETLVALAIS